MSAKSCVVHYKGSKKKENSLPLTREKYDRLIEARAAREQLGGGNRHEQGKTIPDTFQDGSYACHPSCYKRYTMAISMAKTSALKRKPDVELTPPSAAKKRRASLSAAVLFPEHCMHPDCLSTERRVFGKGPHGKTRQGPVQLLTMNACQTILESAIALRDEEMLTKIRGQDLIAREFKMHRSCFRAYTRIVSVNRRTMTPDTDGQDEPNPDWLRRLQQFVSDNIIRSGRSVSLRLLTDVYGFDSDDSRRRAKVKEILQKIFPEQLLFVTVDYHSVQVVISLSSITNVDAKGFVKDNDRLCFGRVCEVLQLEMDEVIQNADPLPWPPTPESLRGPDRKVPPRLIEFIVDVLHRKDSHHLPGIETKRLAESYSQDILFGYSGGAFMTEKHVELGTGLHSLTGLKIPVAILARFGHCIKYDTIRAIEAGQAELARKLSENGYELPLIPKTEDDVVRTIFWWDNYDESKENRSGGIHTTHGVGWQEPGNGATSRPTLPNMDLEKRRSFTSRTVPLPVVKINPHALPPTLPTSRPDNQLAIRENQREVFLWKTMRLYHGLTQQIVPQFIGHMTVTHANPMRPKTDMTFLPPIMRPITDYGTITECIYQSQRMAGHCNLKYVHIVTDVGAASKFYHVVWNNPNEFKNVIIHLGDMHAFMENFAVVGKFVDGSGFEEIVFQSGQAQSGTIRGVLSGKHYNRAWSTHEAFSEAIDRLFMKTYMSSELQQISDFITRLPERSDVRNALLQSGLLDEVHDKYVSLKTECVNGAMGLTPKYWMMYTDAMEKQMVMRSAINMDDFEARLTSWQYFLPFYFSMNKQNYARYGTYYTQQMIHLDETHPGAREELQSVSICRTDDGIGQSIDAGGEQTFMRSAKTAGGIRNISHRPDTYEKWVRNRPYAAQMVEALYQLADMDDSTNPRKCLRPSQIGKSENAVRGIMETIDQYFVSPFDTSLSPDQLYNLVSGKPLDKSATDSLLSCYDRGIEASDQFRERLAAKEDTLRYFDPISRVPWKSFRDGAAKSKVRSKNGKVKDIALQRDILGILAARSTEVEKPIDFKTALSFPLAPVPLSLASSDGMRRKTVKSKLMETLEIPSSDSVPTDPNMIFILDVIAQIRAMVNVPETFRLLTRRLLKDIPSRYETVYLACDRYDTTSIKSAEQSLRGEHDVTQYCVSKPDMKIPEFATFMKNGNNKRQMLERIKDVLVEERNQLGSRVIFFTVGSECLRISVDGYAVVNELCTDHIEADTMIAYLAKHALDKNGGGKTTCLVRSPSGDIDIPIILMNHQHENLSIVIDNGTGKFRKYLSISDSPLSVMHKTAMVGFHAFTGNDYNSSFFYKGKVPLWDKIKQDDTMLQAFSRLGTEQDVSSDLLIEIEKVVCRFYGQKKLDDVNDARYSIFWSNYKRNKIIDLCFLPPCRSSLVLHTKRANFIARMWRRSQNPILSLPSASEHGWTSDFNINWVEKAYPDELSDLLMDVDDDEELELDDDDEETHDEIYSVEDFADQVAGELY